MDSKIKSDMYDLENDIKFVIIMTRSEEKHHDQIKESYFNENTD